MRRLALATMLICVHTLGIGAETDDTPASRRMAAERYAETIDMPKMLADLGKADKAKTPGT